MMGLSEVEELTEIQPRLLQETATRQTAEAEMARLGAELERLRNE